MATLDSITKLKAKVDQLRAKAERAKGAALVIRKTLTETWACSNLKEAKALLAAKKANAQKLKDDFDEQFSEFQENWADELAAVE